MFGHKMRIMTERCAVLLRPPEEKDLEGPIKGFSSLDVVRWMGRIDVPTPKKEQEWFAKASESKDSYVWAIVPDGSDVAIGVTSLGGLDLRSRSAVSGITIWEKAMWGRGYASTSHLGRTLFASSVLGLCTIESHARAPNIASLKALQSVGYVVTGSSPKTIYMADLASGVGKWWDTYHLLWTNPGMAKLLYGEDTIPDNIQSGLSIAEVSLAKAVTCVKFV